MGGAKVMGWTGWTVHQKGPLIFVIFKYIKHYTYINLYIGILKQGPDTVLVC